jgi:hypothetical protein
MNQKTDNQGASFTSDKNINLLAARADELRQALRQCHVALLAEYTSSTYYPHPDGTGEFQLDFWERQVVITYPAFEMSDLLSRQPLNPGQQALILYYFYTANGAQITGAWISFSDLQDGRFYTSAFQGYTGRELAKNFQNDSLLFESAARLLNGKPYPLGDVAFEFTMLPKIHLLVVFWQGDEDFPPNYQILFDAAVNNFLPTDACAIAGSMLTRKLISASR